MWVVNYIKCGRREINFFVHLASTRFSVLWRSFSRTALQLVAAQGTRTHNEALEFPLAPYGRYIDRV